MMWSDLPEEQRPKWRHIALSNLQLYGKVAKAADCAGQLSPITNGNGSKRRRRAA